MPNLLTSFVGRDRDVTGVRKNLAAARLVTLTGPGGVGKTRLAAEACGSLDAAAWLVELAPVTDPACADALLPPASVLPVLSASAVDAIAVSALREPDGPAEAAVLAATLLGAAHSLRGAFDEGSLDAPRARDAARRQLGEAAFAAAYERGRALAHDEAVALAASAVAGPARAVLRTGPGGRRMTCDFWGS